MAASPFQRAKGWLLLNDPKWTKEEREDNVLVRKLDIFFCSYLALSAIVKYLDQTNIANAYVSGLKEDLNIVSNQYNYFTTFFNIGYIVCIPISSFVINSVIRPSLWIPTLEVLWGIGTGGLAAARSYKDIYGLRFFIGFCEGTAWPGTMILLLSWYTPSEVGKRLAIYQSATSLGGIFSGALQSALYNNLNGAGGLAGWRWLFVINSVITVVVALWGYIGCPDYPNKPNPWSKWLNKTDIAASERRMGKERRTLPQGWKWPVIKSVVSRPQNWAIWATYTALGQGATGNGYFNLWLKSLKNADGRLRYSVSDLNIIPIICNCITIGSLIVFLTLSDRFRTQWPFLVFLGLIGVVFTTIMVVWNVPRATIFASYLVLNVCSPYANLIIAWIGTLAKHSAEERAILISAVVVTYYSITAGAPLKVWPASEAPNYKIGWKYALAMYCVGTPLVLITLYFDRRQQRLDAGKSAEDTWGKDESVESLGAKV